MSVLARFSGCTGVVLYSLGKSKQQVGVVPSDAVGPETAEMAMPIEDDGFDGKDNQAGRQGGALLPL